MFWQFSDDAESLYLFVVIEYDQLMPDDVEKILIESEDSQVTSHDQFCTECTFVDSLFI